VDVSMVSIERNDTKVRDPHEVVYDVTIRVDAQDRTFEVFVATGKIGSHAIPYATFRDTSELRIFRYDQRPITDMLRAALGVYNRERAMLPA